MAGHARPLCEGRDEVQDRKKKGLLEEAARLKELSDLMKAVGGDKGCDRRSITLHNVKQVRRLKEHLGCHLG